MAKTTNAASDNTLKFLGFHYQYLIALECCLNSKQDDTIHIEQYGDVSNRETIIEVKHHIEEEHRLSDRHEDFWKTLKNWVVDYKIVEDYSKIILLTTSVIDENSAFYGWNELKKEERYKKIKEIISTKITETIKPFVSVIFNFTSEYKESNLLQILEKFQISHSYLGIEKKIEELAQHDKLAAIPKHNKDSFLNALLGKIILPKTLTKDYKWEISMNSFLSYIESESKHFVGKALQLPKFPKEPLNYLTYEESLFVKEIHKIGYSKAVERAIDDFHQSGKMQVFLIDQDIEYAEIIEDYENDLEDDILQNKDKFTVNFDKSKDVRQNSLLFYIDCMQFPNKSIKNIEQNTKEFQHGTIHRVTDSGRISWLIEEQI